MSFIVIEHYQFPLNDPYREGTILSAEEALVLNWHRARLIQKAVTRWVADAIDRSPHDICTMEELDAIAAEVAEFDRQYNLSFKKEPRGSILEYHLESIAEAILRRSGITNPKKEDVERVKRTPQVQEQARDRVRSGIFTFEDLLS